VAQLVKDYEDFTEVNKQLEKMYDTAIVSFKASATFDYYDCWQIALWMMVLKRPGSFADIGDTISGRA
jgi:hypothetical protein